MSNQEKILCDFAVSEFTHDFKEPRGAMKIASEMVRGEGNSNFVAASGKEKMNYKDFADQFSTILSLSLPVNCSDRKKVPLPYAYSEEKLVDMMLGKKLWENIKKGIVPSGTKIQTINNNNFILKSLSIEDNFTDGNGRIQGNLIHNALFGDTIPVFLVDVPSNFLNYLKMPDVDTEQAKMGKLSSNKDRPQAIIFTPLVVTSDSATSKVNITSESNLQDYFNPSFSGGVKYINVVDLQSFQPPNWNTNDNRGFFSKYRVETYMDEIKFSVNKKNKKIDITQSIGQNWTGLQYQENMGGSGGKNGLMRRVPADKLNTQPETASKALKLLFPTGKAPNNLQINQTRLNNIKKNILSNKPNNEYWNMERFNLEIQAKRSGDWLPVLYILNMNDDKKKQFFTFKNTDEFKKIIQDFNKSTRIDNQESAIRGNIPAQFNKNNMYIVTNDQPLVAYCLFTHVNVIYIRSKSNNFPNTRYIMFQRS